MFRPAANKTVVLSRRAIRGILQSDKIWALDNVNLESTSPARGLRDRPPARHQNRIAYMPSSRVTMRIGSTRSVSLVSTAAMSNSYRKASRTSARQDLRPSLFPRSSRHTRLAAPNLPEARPAGGSRAVAPGRPLLIDQKISVVDHHLRQCRDRAQVGMLPSRRIGVDSPRNVGGDASNPVAARNRFPAACGTERGQPKRVVFYAVPMVRIHLPPAESR